MRCPGDGKDLIPDQTSAAIQACNQAIFVLNDRFYDYLIPRQLASIDNVIELLNDRALQIEELCVLNLLLAAVLAKAISREDQYGVYERHLAILLQICGRKILSSSPTVSSIHAEHIRDLYSSIGNVVTHFGNKLHHFYIPTIRNIVDYVIDHVVTRSNTDFAFHAVAGLRTSSIIPALITAFPIIRCDGAFTLPVLTVLADVQDFLPETAAVMLDHHLANHLIEIVDEVLRDCSGLIVHRDPLFFTAGLLLRMSGTTEDITVLERAFANEKAVMVVGKILKQYFQTVHDTDREIRNSFAAILLQFNRLATKSSKMLKALVDQGLLTWWLQVATRPEFSSENIEVGNLRLQMHKKDAALKQIFFRGLIFAVELIHETSLYALMVCSLFSHFKPFSYHKRPYWSRFHYERHRMVALEVLTIIYSQVAATYHQLSGNEIVLDLLNGLVGLDGALYQDTETDSKNRSGEPDLLLLTIRLMKTVLQSETIDMSILLDFCIAKGGVMSMVQTLNFVYQEKDITGETKTFLMLRDILCSFNHVAQQVPEILAAVQSLCGKLLLRIMDLRLNWLLPGHSDILRCIFVSVGTWVIGNHESEMQFLLGHGLERLIELFCDIPCDLQLDLLGPFEQIFLQSFRITKYLQYLPCEDFLHALNDLWTMEPARCDLYGMFVLLQSTWDKNKGNCMGHPFKLAEDYIASEMSKIVDDFLEKEKKNENVSEESKKLVLLLHAGTGNSYDEERQNIVTAMGECSKLLPQVLRKAHEKITGKDPCDDNLYTEGTKSSIRSRSRSFERCRKG